MHSFTRAIRVAIVLAALALDACASNNSTPGVFIGGNYFGNITDNQSGTGSLTAGLTQSGSSLSGSWNVSFNGNAVPGSASGSVSGNSFYLTVTTSACSYNVNGTSSGNGTQLSGSYTPNNPCTDSGTFSISRQ